MTIIIIAIGIIIITMIMSLVMGLGSNKGREFSTSQGEMAIIKW